MTRNTDTQKSNPTSPPLFVDSNDELDKLCKQLQASNFLALDTEFIRERTYYSKLCLIQIADENIVACIDPLVITDLEPLRQLLFNTSTTKVFHASHQDMEIFYKLWGQLPTLIYDSQIAATLLGMGESIGYASLIKRVLDVDIDKAHSRTDWGKRPLSTEQINYAADDVRYLAQLYPIQKKQLQELGRLQWLDEDFSSLSRIDRYHVDPDTVWRKVKGIKKLKRGQLVILQSLAAWREQEAIKQDRPRRRVLSDEALVDLSRLMPDSPEKLASYRGISPGAQKSFGKALISVISSARQQPKDSWPELSSRQPLSNLQEAQIDAVSALLRLVADQCHITASSLATRKDLEQLVRGDRDLALLHGWRYQHAGQQLVAFLDGDISLYNDHGKLMAK